MSKKWHVNEDKAWFKKWWPEDIPKNIEFEEISMGEFFERARKEYGSLNHMWFLETWWTYEETGQAVDRVATALDTLGVKKGDALAFLMPNSPQYIICYYACQKLGVIPVGINPTYKSLEILHFMEIINPKALICLEMLYNLKLKPIIDKTSIEFIVTTEITDLVKGNSNLNDFIAKKTQNIQKPKIDFQPSYNFYELLSTEPNLPKVDIDPLNDPAGYFMTGGTTGLPKACVVTHYNFTSVATLIKYKLGKEKIEGIAQVGINPFFHISGSLNCINTPTNIGGYVIIFPKAPKVEELLKTMDRLPTPQGVSMSIAEIIYKRIADFPDVDKYKNALKKFRINTCGAGPLHKPIRDKYEAVTGGTLVDGYGLTESTGLVSAGNFWSEYPIGSIGLPGPSVDWAIFDPDDFEKGPIADGLPGSKYGKENSGELCACGPQMFKEYLNQPEETADTLKEWDGRIWLRTGDIGYMDEDGTVTLHDRKKQLIKVAGHSVFPTEVETMLMRHECVSDAAVAGLPDPEGKVGEITKAWVQLQPDCKGKITEYQLSAWMNENFTYWKCPKLIEFIEQIPKNMIGKVQKRQLQESDPLWKKD
jgi:long-chain acyl-CoA synthetase